MGIWNSTLVYVGARTLLAGAMIALLLRRRVGAFHAGGQVVSDLSCAAFLLAYVNPAIRDDIGVLVIPLLLLTSGLAAQNAPTPAAIAPRLDTPQARVIVATLEPRTPSVAPATGFDLQTWTPWAVCLAGLAAVLGHSRSVWLNFTGGVTLTNATTAVLDSRLPPARRLSAMFRTWSLSR